MGVFQFRGFLMAVVSGEIVDKTGVGTGKCTDGAPEVEASTLGVWSPEACAAFVSIIAEPRIVVAQ